MKSIMHNKQDGTCYLCMLLHNDYGKKNPRQEHHVPFGRGIRKLSEKYGLKVYLCIPHHLYDGGEEAVHRNDEVRRMLDKEAQKAFERKYPNLLFLDVFGKNLLDDADRQQACENPKPEREGFVPLDNPLVGGIDW